MLRHAPKRSYSGLTICLSFPSRFDKQELLSGNGGYYFNKNCLEPETNRYLSDIRLIDDKSPLLPDTKCVLLLGEKAHRLYTGASTTLDENRGSPIIVNGIPTISSFAPQDAEDMVDHEKRHNPNYETVAEFMSEYIQAGETFAEKSRTRTARRNYAFWLKQDTKKALRIVDNNGRLPDELLPEPVYRIYPSSEEVIYDFNNTTGDVLFYDMETDIDTLDMRCFAYMFLSKPNVVKVVPTLNLDYSYAYSNLPALLLSKARAMRRNRVVAHNGALFDFLILALKYKIAVGADLYDTMITAQRMYPEVEKSLGHCMTLASYQGYHKSEGDHTYRTQQQADRLYKYCGKDVYGMALVYLWQMQQLEKDAGLKHAVLLAQRAIRPYLVQTLFGQKYDEELRSKWVKWNDRRMTILLRIMKALTGDYAEELISPQRCVKYFHGFLGYEVESRTEKGEPSVDEGALIQFRLKHPDNPVISLLMKYRSLKKETGTLTFKPWISPVTQTSNVLVEENRTAA